MSKEELPESNETPLSALKMIYYYLRNKCFPLYIILIGQAGQSRRNKWFCLQVIQLFIDSIIHIIGQSLSQSSDCIEVHEEILDMRNRS